MSAKTFWRLTSIVALGTIAYWLGSGRGGVPPETTRAIVREGLEPLAALRERVARLEAELVSLRSAATAEGLDGEAAPTPAGETRWDALAAELSTLQRRLRGLEQDPIRRGYSYLGSDSAELRRQGINILARVARFDPEARAAIRELLGDPSARVREQAAQKLAKLADEESAPEMLALLGDSDARTRRRAIQALGAVKAREAAGEIGRNLVSDADERVRREAADVLGKLGAREAEEFLARALTDPSEAVRGEAIASLGEVGATASVPLLRAIYEEDSGRHRPRLVLALKQLGDAAPLRREVLRLSESAASDPDERVRQQAIRQIRLLARESSQEIFARALEDPSPRVRLEAEKALK